jgi:hypothetical protein
MHADRHLPVGVVFAVRPGCLGSEDGFGKATKHGIVCSFDRDV